MTSQDKDTNENFDNCVRGYVFVTSNDPETPDNLLNLNTKYTQDEDLIIRADTMDESSPFAIVIPVNAKTIERFDEIFEDIKAISGDASAKKTIVSIHHTYHPDPPHSAKGYVSADEYQRDPTGPNPGPQDHNVWG